MSEESATRLYIQYRNQRDEALARIHALTQQVEEAREQASLQGQRGDLLRVENRKAREGLERFERIFGPPTQLDSGEVRRYRQVVRDTLNAMEEE